MKRITTPLLASIVILASCAKQDLKPNTDFNPDGAQQNIDGSVTMQRYCASNEVLEKQIAENPARGQALDDLERFTESYRGRASRGAGVLYVPVVVHVVLTNPGQVTDAQIQSQID